MGIVISTDFIILALIGVTPLLLVLVWPFFFGSQSKAKPASERAQNIEETLLVQRDSIYKTIRDLDFDYETGKLTDEDYRSQREMWVERGVEVLKALDAEGYSDDASDDHKPWRPSGPDASTDLDAEIEAAVRSRRSTA